MKRLKPRARFALCVRTNGAEDMEQWKVYQILPDRAAGQEGYLRVIDESGEDYLYPAEYFVTVNLPAAVVHELQLQADGALQPVHRRSGKMRLRGARG